MEKEVYSEFLDVKHDLEKYLLGKKREFEALSFRLGGIAGLVSVDNVTLLENIPMINAEMNRLSSEYLRVKNILNELESIRKSMISVNYGLSPQSAYEQLKESQEFQDIMEEIKNSKNLQDAELKLAN